MAQPGIDPGTLSNWGEIPNHKTSYPAFIYFLYLRTEKLSLLLYYSVSKCTHNLFYDSYYNCLPMILFTNYIRTTTTNRQVSKTYVATSYIVLKESFPTVASETSISKFMSSWWKIVAGGKNWCRVALVRVRATWNILYNSFLIFNTLFPCFLNISPKQNCIVEVRHK